MNKREIKKWLDSFDITIYTINDDLTVDVPEGVYLWGRQLTSLPFQFGTIKGSFSCSDNKLTSLEHCPKVVHGDFWCDMNKLISLEHCPKVVHGGFYCDDSLEKDPRYLRWLLARKLKEL